MFLSKIKSAGIGGLASLATRASSAPNVGAVWTIPVPSSVVTKSPKITLNAFSGFSCGRGESFQICSYLISTSSWPFKVSLM